ncbi:LacI family DNA-binding transcriptional regulator [Streptomyces scopuliridis]
MTDPFGAALAQEVEKAATELGLGVMVHSDTRDEDALDRYASLLAAQRILGVVVAVATGADQMVSVLRNYGLPHVTVGDDHAEEPGCVVRTDDLVGAHMAMQHVLQLGHEVIAYMDGTDSQQSRCRAQGVAMALRAVNAAPRQALCVQVDVVDVSAGKQAARLLLGLRHRPSAIFCGDDRLALGVLQCLYEADVRVPEDMALVGYGDSGHASTAAVPLTSVSRQVPELARQAIRLLAREEASHDGALVDEHVVIRPKLVVRRTSLHVNTRR